MWSTLNDEIPLASAISARLQCVALGGVSCTVLAMTFSRVSMGGGGTCDGRFLSRNRLATPALKYRCCQCQTVGFEVYACCIISKLLMSIRRRQHDLGPPKKVAHGVVVTDQSLMLATFDAANLKADFIASHARTVEHQAAYGSPVGCCEHQFRLMNFVRTRPLSHI